MHILRGQQLDVATRLTSSQSNSSLFYFSFEIEDKKVALYLNYGKLRYSYWGFQPTMNRSITYIKLSSRGLLLFDVKYKKIAQIPSEGIHPLRFLALNNETGNLGLYHYSPEKGKFEASFQALNSTCDLPISCRPYGICTFSNSCSCIQLLANENKGGADCSGGITGGFCNGKEAEMLEIDNISSVLKNVTRVVNISKKTCESLCLQDCKCAAALYFGNASTDEAECYLYKLVLGLKQVEKGTGFSYMVKVPKGTVKNHERHNVKRWVFVVAGGVDGLIFKIILKVVTLSYSAMLQTKQCSVALRPVYIIYLIPWLTKCCYKFLSISNVQVLKRERKREHYIQTSIVFLDFFFHFLSPPLFFHKCY